MGEAGKYFRFFLKQFRQKQCIRCKECGETLKIFICLSKTEKKAKNILLYYVFCKTSPLKSIKHKSLRTVESREQG